MAVEQRNRGLWLETALLFAAWTVFGLISANQVYVQFELIGRPVSWRHALRERHGPAAGLQANVTGLRVQRQVWVR